VALVVCLIHKNVTQDFAGAVFGVSQATVSRRRDLGQALGKLTEWRRSGSDAIGWYASRVVGRSVAGGLERRLGLTLTAAADGHARTPGSTQVGLCRHRTTQLPTR